jgi:RNA polymerase primary sigma factor
MAQAAVAQAVVARAKVEKKITKKVSANGASKPKGARPIESKLPKTFQTKSLEQAFVHFLQLSCPGPDSPTAIQAEWKRRLASPIEFMTSETFASPEAEATVLAETLMGTGLAEQIAKPGKVLALPAHLARLCEAKLLTPDEEKALFNRMNFLKYQADQICKTLDGGNSLGWDLRAVDKFDAGLGFRFSTYATQVVRRNTYRRVMEKQAERQRIAGSIHENGIDISDDQKESSMSEARWHELRSKLSLMLDHLDRREKLIIRARFSLGGHRRIQTLQRLADKLGVSKERIRQLEKRALDKLRSMVEVSPMPELDV